MKIVLPAQFVTFVLKSSKCSNGHQGITIGERMEVTPMISIDPHSVYHFRYPLF